MGQRSESVFGADKNHLAALHSGDSFELRLQRKRIRGFNGDRQPSAIGLSGLAATNGLQSQTDRLQKPRTFAQMEDKPAGGQHTCFRRFLFRFPAHDTILRPLAEKINELKKLLS